VITTLIRKKKKPPPSSEETRRHGPQEEGNKALLGICAAMSSAEIEKSDQEIMGGYPTGVKT
jgi:hypothetical protein